MTDIQGAARPHSLSFLTDSFAGIALGFVACSALGLGFLLGLPAPVHGGNGHFVHGVGAVNSSMGGAGTGLPSDVLGALFLNPALLADVEGHQMVFGVEFVQSDASVTSTVQTPFGPLTGSTEDGSDLTPIPAVGWAYRPEDGSLALGFGVLGLAGFSTDYPADPANPILVPQPQGLGRVQADYTLLQIPFAVAWQATEDLSLGFQLNGGWATLEATPFAGVAPDCSGPTTCFFTSVDKDGAFGVGFQLGLHYRVSDALSLGLSYVSEQSYEDFSWNATVTNPNLPTFGLSRRVRFDLDSPQRVGVGLGFEPNEHWSLGLDVRWVNYSDTDGFEEGPIDPATLTAPGLGWDDMWVYAVGAQYRFTNGVTLRAGYNLSDAAVQPRTAFFNVQSPANFEDHYTLGLGFPLYDHLDVHVGYYHVPDNAVGGPFQSPLGPVPGTRVENEISVDSFLFAFTFNP